MKKITFETPRLYGDHHVTEVRRILLEMPGVQEVYASSAFRVIEATFEPARVTTEQLRSRLEEAGYLGDMPFVSEPGVAQTRADGSGFFRQAAYYETTKQTISFAQRVQPEGEALWPCPGLGVLKMHDE